ncbi:acyl--CoA ligase [Thiotrichales bacterium 19S11-10]|nr:acyl--CoA ligase [Thiotrichales bacterium 19S11-10]
MAFNLFQMMKQYGDKVALYTKDSQLTFNDLLIQSQLLAQILNEKGITNGSKLFIYLDNRVETVLLYLASWINGNTVIPVNYRLKPYELASIFKVIQPDLFITTNERVSILTIDSQLKLQTVESLSEKLKQYEGNINLESIINYPYSDTDIACIHFTSGTTGLYKAVAHSFQQINDYTFERTLDMEYGSSDRLLVCLSLMHAFSFSYQLLPALAMGIPCILAKGFDEKMIFDLANQYHATSISLLPAQCYYLSQYAKKNGLTIDSLNDCISAGDVLPKAIANEFAHNFNIVPREGLGMTECFGYTLTNKSDNSHTHAGKPLTNVKLQLSEKGELLIQSTGNMLGYYSDERGLYATPGANGIKSGDIASLDKDGCLHFKGRMRHMIIRDGSNIMPLEIEHALYQHPEVLEACIVGITDDVHGQRVYGQVVLQAGSQLQEAGLKEFLSFYLADYKIPEMIEFVQSLPKNTMGKTDRDVIQKQVEQRLKDSLEMA